MRINVTDRAKVQAALDEVQAKCSARLMNIDRLEHSIKRLDARLSRFILKGEFKGVTAVIESYSGKATGRYIKDSTKVTVKRGASGWFVTNIDRGHISGRVDPIRVESGVTPEKLDTFFWQKGAGVELNAEN